jgi:hypothetical protein
MEEGSLRFAQAVSKDQLQNDKGLWDECRQGDRLSPMAVTFRGLILRQAQDDGIFHDQISPRMIRHLAVTELPQRKTSAARDRGGDQGESPPFTPHCPLLGNISRS